MAVLTKSINESFGFSEAEAKTPKKYISELVAFAESLTNAFSKAISETIDVADTILRNGNVPLFDLLVQSTVLTREELANLADSPNVGFTNFQTFYPADYDFQVGIAGVRVTGAINSGRAGIASLQHNVDVKDVVERGEATIAASGTTQVLFTKTFTQAPEVVVAFKSGATLGIPRVISITTTYVEIELYDTSNVQITGDVTYAAVGY